MQEEIKSAETTDNEVVADATTLDEEIAIADGDDGESVQFSDTDKVDEVKDDEVSKPKQSKEENKKFADKRRTEKANQEEKELQWVKEYIGKNPFTNEPIETMRDVKVYKTMKQIDKEGGDPVLDYHKYAGLEEQKQVETAKAKEERIKEDIKSFRDAYPNVDLNELQKDKDFESFANELVGKVPMATIYKSYIALKGGLSAKATETAKEDLAKKMAKDNTSVGNLDSKGSVDSPKYTMEQIDKMSQSEIDKNWKDVEKSYDYWQTHKH